MRGYQYHASVEGCFARVRFSSAFGAANDRQDATISFNNNNKNKRTNDRLDKYIQEGEDLLLSSAKSLSNNPLCRKELMDDPSVREVSIKQLKRAAQMERLICEVLEKLEYNGDDTFCYEGESIEISSVEVSPDLRYSRVYWTLPVTMIESGESEIMEASKQIQNMLDRHGSRIMQYHLSRSFRSKRFSTKIRFISTDQQLTHNRALLNDMGRLNSFVGSRND